MQQVYTGTKNTKRTRFAATLQTIKRGSLGVLFAIGALSATTATAQSNQKISAPNFVEISNDRGGLLRDRLIELQLLRQTGRQVRITGNICYSTCTMFLGLPQTCVSPQTTFGFHGPSSYGRPLEPAIFEEASQIMASHYPDVLKTWYMETGRHEIVDIYRFKGADIIRMGVSSCPVAIPSS